MIRYILGLAFYIVSSTICFSQIKCGPPNTVIMVLGAPAYLTKDPITLLSIKNQIIKLHGVEPPEFDIAMIMYKGQSLSVGIGNDKLICEAISEEGLNAIEIAKFIVPIDT